MKPRLNEIPEIYFYGDSKACTKDTKVPYFHKPRWQDVQTKPTQELFAGKGSWFYHK